MFLNIESFNTKYKNKKIGFTCSCFDLLHSGHCIMLKDAKEQCDILIVGLQTDPTIDRPEKNKPIQTFEERKIMIETIKYVDEVITYSTEKDLYDLLVLLNPDVRIIGSDWCNKKYTGYELPITMYWHKRTHSWSTSELRKRVYEREKIKDLIFQ
uniref:Cytidyltransferase-like domain-containing protein n=1 Tax=viral metagenome TaxID=1070528 RepID=A0A6C0J5F9_9ZZZZ